MTRLEKYLVATATEIIEAETTVSRYFVIGNVKVRVSDHLSKMSDADLQVIIRNTDGGSLTFDGTIIESRLKEKQLTSKQREVFRRTKSTWDISQIGTLPSMIKVDLGLSNGSVNEDV